eukprot:623199-Pyramimonas_sp.AAC.1
MNLSAGHERRVLQQLHRLPFTLVNLAIKPPDEYCKKRQDLCIYIRDAPDRMLEINAQKLRFIFTDDINQGADHGTISVEFWAVGKYIRRMLIPD